jgi:hypothetical protein
MIDKYAVFSTHAKERLLESGIGIGKASYMLYNAEPEKLPRNLRESKYKKYGENENEIYLRYDTFIFTLRPIKDKYTGDECYLVLTVTDQRVTFEVPKGKYYQRKTSHNHI